MTTQRNRIQQVRRRPESMGLFVCLCVAVINTVDADLIQTRPIPMKSRPVRRRHVPFASNGRTVLMLAAAASSSGGGGGSGSK
jgi:hypothetical protein